MGRKTTQKIFLLLPLESLGYRQYVYGRRLGFFHLCVLKDCAPTRECSFLLQFPSLKIIPFVRSHKGDANNE